MITLCFQAMDAIKKMKSSYPKDDIKRLEKEVSYKAKFSLDCMEVKFCPIGFLTFCYVPRLKS